MASRSCFAAPSASKFSRGKIYKQPLNYEPKIVQIKSQL